MRLDAIFDHSHPVTRWIRWRVHVTPLPGNEGSFFIISSRPRAILRSLTAVMREARDLLLPKQRRKILCRGASSRTLSTVCDLCQIKLNQPVCCFRCFKLVGWWTSFLFDADVHPTMKHFGQQRQVRFNQIADQTTRKEKEFSASSWEILLAKKRSQKSM